MNTAVKIQKLDASDQERISTIANWYFDEWNTPVEKTIQRLSNQPNEDVLFQLILTLNGKLVGTGGLCVQVNLLQVHKTFTQYKPWIALLYTDKNYRKQGYGKVLLEHMEWHARQEKLDKIYLYTFTAESLYRRGGWKPIDHVPYKGHRTTIMEKDLRT